MQEKDKGTFFGGLLVLLMGIPAIVNALLDACNLGNSKLNSLIKPTFWFFAALALLGWVVPFGIDGLNNLVTGLSTGITSSLDYVTGVLTSLTGGGTEAVVPVAAPTTDVPLLTD